MPAQRDLSVSHTRVGDVLNMLNRPEDALNSFRTSLTILEKLAAANPSRADLQGDLALHYVKFAMLLVAGKRFEEALTQFRRCEAIFEGLWDSYPTERLWSAVCRTPATGLEMC